MKTPDVYVISMMNPSTRLLYKLGRYFIALPGLILNGIKATGKGVLGLLSAVVVGPVNISRMFIKGDIFTKVSFVILGFGCVLRGQIVKGLLFLLLFSVMLYSIFGFGWQYLQDFGTLGTVAESEWIDPDTGLIMYGTADNSMLILLYSVMILFVIVALLVVYYAGVKACYEAQLLKERSLPVPKFKDDVKSLLNNRYHVTLLSLPTLMAVLFVILPLIFMILIAFTNYDKSHQPPGNLFTWVGLQNFGDIFGKSASKSNTFRYLLSWTIVWAIFATFANYLFGMLLANLINKKGVRFKRFWRTIFVLTIAVPQFVSLLVMRSIFSDYGTANLIIEQMGGTAINFLSDGKLARIMVLIINMWVGIPYSMLITSGILMNIPEDIYESARIDGAGPLRTYMSITLPYMLFVTTPYLITQFVGNFNNFNVIYLLTQGEPKSVYLYQAGETDLLVTWLYKLTVNFQDYNLASVIGILVFVISAAMSLIVYNSSSSVKSEEVFS